MGSITPQQREARARYWAQKQGVQFGVPDYTLAIRQMHQMEAPVISRRTRGELVIPSPTPGWSFIGPLPMLNAQSNFGGPLFTPTPTPTPTPAPTPTSTSTATATPAPTPTPVPVQTTYNATGRVTSAAFDPKSHEVFVGAANGGLWASTDMGTSFHEIPITVPDGSVGTEAIGAIVLNPATLPTTIYVATGEANNGGDSYYGQGIFESTDLGNTWTSLEFALFRRAAFTKMAINNNVTPPTIFAAAGLGFTASRADADYQFTDPERSSGLFRSTDAGTSWMQYGVSAFVLGTGGSTFTCSLPGAVDLPCPAEDVAIDPANSNNVYVGIEGLDVFGSTDGGGTWAPECFPNNLPCFPNAGNEMDRESLAVGPPDPAAPPACAGAPCGTVYAMIGSADKVAYSGFFKSTDGGGSWLARPVPSFTNPISGVTIDGSSATDFSQEFFDQILLADPFDLTSSTVFFGGVGLYESTSSGASWTFLPRAGGTHADQHALAFNTADTNTIYLGNDGGAFNFLLNGISGGVAGFKSMNNTINAGQIQGIGPHPTNNNRAIAGYQDNGTQLFTGGLGWNSVELGDGGFALFDHINPNLAYHTFASAGSVPTIARSTDSGSTWDSVDPSNSINTLLNALGDPGANFYPPLADDPTNPGRVLFGAHFVYASTDGMLSWQQQENVDLTGGCGDGSCALQDIEFARSDPTRAWALSIANPPVPFKLFNTRQANLNNGATWNDVTSNLRFSSASTQATGIATDPFHPATAYLSLSGSRALNDIGHVYRTTDFGASWALLDGPPQIGANQPPTSLPDIPMLRVLVDGTDLIGATIYAASDIGVFRSTDNGAEWSAFNLGVLPAVPVFDIEQNDNGLVFIGTHGHGAYTLNPPRPLSPALTVTPPSVNFGNAIVLGSNGQRLLGRVIGAFDARNMKQNRPALMSGVPQIIGAEAGDFPIQTNGCGTGSLLLAPNTGCSVKVQFQPTMTGLRSATLMFTDTASNSPQLVNLTGNGQQGKVFVNPLSLSFFPRRVGSPSPAISATLSNPNPVFLDIGAINIVSISGAQNDYGFSTTCRTVLGPHSSCTVGVVFTPTATGPRSATLQLFDDAVGSPQQVKLIGQGR